MTDKTVNDDELRDHYDFDFSNAKPNPYAALFGPLKPGGRVVYLDPEIAERFETSEEVNQVLKDVVEAMLRTNNSKKSSSTKACVKKKQTSNSVINAFKTQGLLKKWKMVSGKMNLIQTTKIAAPKKTVKKHAKKPAKALSSR